MSEQIGTAYTRGTATAQITPSGVPAYIERIIINSSTSLVLTVRNGDATGDTVFDTVTLAQGDNITFRTIFSKGCHVTVASGSGNFTVIWG